MSSIPEFGELLAGSQRSAVHLETRDTYFSNPRFEAWQRGQRVDWADRASWWRPFHQDIADAVARGVTVRRARVVSEPVSDYIRWEHHQTRANLEAGEIVRWLPRRLAVDLLLPANDFWIFDGRLMRVHHFSGDGEWIGKELCADQKVVEACSAAFVSIWERAIPHDEYEIK
ncbi:hypothetical protein Sipo8835_29440 [Streptomyces ipomoeae]|jgi:hypothetical protein|uniref:DUF6879 domain-containing protein n=2 Tax=Streptomyces ipomoeae TaxID=103232 RepID=L1KLS1_9ACTN|nr:DUF6879 family protein [Streptomyces ipomoeae]EKX61430.1 hypothetical protein STRIP9103_04191 [Streptomyces ipomoeae 91-03]MDX2697622.1 hypothetical protein [Streptomyces ipomoeae]MDX2825063.1 hypothetical protein [Streptomyces ipomoeae]MDX2843402.1 hypothetical protein [Streptomyces ipomoeae]MDX2877637.1 hypothetical protein [Streptomyces ipomoeae]